MCVDTTKYVHFLVGKGFYDWKYAFKHLRSRHVARCSVFWGGKTFVLSIYVTKKFLEKKFGKGTKGFVGIALSLPRGYTPAKET